jgi:hypothetical protein
METDEIVKNLEDRLGRVYARQRMGIETDHEAQVFGQGLNFFHIENLTSSHFLIEWILKLSGLYWKGRKNAGDVQLRTNVIESPLVPPAFDGFIILQLSDLHADMSETAMTRVRELVQGLHYDICVLTGDYRGKTWGPHEAALQGVARVQASLRSQTYAVLGNHDTIRMVPGLDAMGIRTLLNEHVLIERGGDCIHLAGIDDAHYFRVDNIEKAASSIPFCLAGTRMVAKSVCPAALQLHWILSCRGKWAPVHGVTQTWLDTHLLALEPLLYPSASTVHQRLRYIGSVGIIQSDTQ